MNSALSTRILVTLFCSVIMLPGLQALAFSAPKPAVDACIDALEQKYGFREHEFSLEQVRAKPIGVNAAVIYLRTIATSEIEQSRERLYCKVDVDGSVMQLRSTQR